MVPFLCLKILVGGECGSYPDWNNRLIVWGHGVFGQLQDPLNPNLGRYLIL